jgi:pyridoxamine 5'-phosphate oxidase family protein
MKYFLDSLDIGHLLPEGLAPNPPILLMRPKRNRTTLYILVLKIRKGATKMSAFTNKEIEYLGEQRLGRLATVDGKGHPHVVPVGFRYNSEADTIDIGGHDIAQTKKWRDADKHPRVAFIVDDVLPPWQPRSIEILADAALLESGGEEFGRGLDPQIIRLQPVKIIAWGIDETRQSRNVKNVETIAI